MRITISISDITRRIYAVSAIKAVNADGNCGPAVLTRDNALLLRRLIRDSFALSVGRLADIVTDFSILDPDDGDDLLWIETEAVAASPGVAAESFAAGVLGRTMALAWSGSDLPQAEEYTRLSDTALGQLTRRTARCGCIRRHG